MSTIKRVSGDYTVQTINSGDTITFDTDVTTITGDLTVVGNAVLLGNINADRIFNGTSNVEITTPGGNVQIGVGGIADVVDVGTLGMAVTGVVSASGNVTGANVNTGGIITATGNITGGNVITGGDVSGSGNVFIDTDSASRQATIRFVDSDTDVFPTQVIGSIDWFTSDTTLGARVTSAIRSTYTAESGNAAVEIFTSTGGAAATAKVTVLSTGNVGIGNSSPTHLLSANGTAYFGSTMTAVGNITGGNVLTAGSATATGNIQGGNFNTAGLITATGNVTAGNVISLGLVQAGAAGISATGNVTGGNVLSDGVISATGNLTTTDIFATTISLSGNVIGNVSTGNSVVAGTSVDTPLVITNVIQSDDSVAVKFSDGIQVDTDIEAMGAVSAAGNITGNNIIGITSVTVPAFADDSARNTAIATPVTGMLIYNIANVKFQGFTGASWVDLN